MLFSTARKSGQAIFGTDWIYPLRRLLDVPTRAWEQMVSRGVSEDFEVTDSWKPKLIAAIRSKGRLLREALDELER